MEDSKKQNFIRNVLFAACIAAIIYLAFAYAIPILSPFLVAFIVTALITPLVDLLHRKFGIAKKLSAIVLVTVSYLILIGLLVSSQTGLFSFGQNLWAKTKIITEMMYT
jgi:predicted PurR-regulated permease PerM